MLDLVPLARARKVQNGDGQASPRQQSRRRSRFLRRYGASETTAQIALAAARQPFTAREIVAIVFDGIARRPAPGLT